MKMRKIVGLLAVCCGFGLNGQARGASHAAQASNYVAGDGAASSFDNPAAALGEPTRLTGVGVFPGVVSAFNPPYLTSEIVSIGEEGSIELQLANYLLPLATGSELGVFTNVGLIDNDFPNGVAASPLSAIAGTFGADAAVLEVSADGTSWVSLGEQLFDVPTIGYADVTDPFAETAGNTPSDFGKPYEGALADLAGLSYHDANAPDILDVFAGSGGGSWLDLSSTGLEKIGWLRFSVPSDGNPDTHFQFELDGVSIANNAVGPAVPEPNAVAIGLIGLSALFATRLRRRIA